MQARTEIIRNDTTMQIPTKGVLIGSLECTLDISGEFQISKSYFSIILENDKYVTYKKF